MAKSNVFAAARCGALFREQWVEAGGQSKRMSKSASSGSSASLVGLIGIIAAAAAALFAGGTAYLLTRPAEQSMLLVDSPRLQRVEAGLSEDPFSAVDRFERNEMDLLQFNHDAAALIAPDSSAPAKQARGNPKNDGALPTSLPFEKFRFGISEDDFKNSLSGIAPPDRVKSVLPVMVTNSNVAGSAESRRRTRYAVVSALGELGYVPSDNKHIGYVTAHLPGDLPVRIPFEAFERSSTSEPKPQECTIHRHGSVGRRRSLERPVPHPAAQLARQTGARS